MLVGHFDTVESLDNELARLAHRDGALRLGLAMGLQALKKESGHHVMGFSSIEAYALERCERSARWVQQGLCLVRKLNDLPEIRRALALGTLSWTVTSMLADVATPDDETSWLRVARGLTVRELGHVIAARRSAEEKREEPQPVLHPGDEGNEPNEPNEFCTLTATMDREDACLFECARMVANHLGARTTGDLFTALTAEGFSTLLSLLPEGAMGESDGDDGASEAAQRAWVRQRAKWREQAEVLCAARLRERLLCAHREAESIGAQFSFGGGIEETDAKIRSIAAELVTRDADMGHLAEQFRKTDGWRRLGYATEAQYVRERLGMSVSSLDAKRRFARNLKKLPRLADAIANHEIGYEAARAVSEVATPETVGPWIARARERTVRQLRDEVAAAEMVARLTGESAVAPPSEKTMDRVERAEGRIVSGQAFITGCDESNVTDGRDVKSEARAILDAVLEHFRKIETDSVSRVWHASQISARRSLGRVTLKFRMSVDTRRYYRWMERVFDRWRPTEEPFLRFLCRTFIATWRETLETRVAYASIYARDRFRCRNPTCNRRDVTPHHLKFRSAGGDDSDENVASLCVWCHLRGIHEGRLRARPPASAIRWEIGRVPHTIVEGRRRVRLESVTMARSSALQRHPHPARGFSFHR